MANNRKYNNYILDTSLDEFNTSVRNIVNDDSEIFTKLIHNGGKYFAS